MTRWGWTSPLALSFGNSGWLSRKRFTSTCVAKRPEAKPSSASVRIEASGSLRVSTLP
ncbi:hypothetical protein [Methylorubrum rhodinum]|uniref:hypothetical protein n=1 Tax=Methylorubrum rhodinum TaxID=29428 RepID=UPI0028ACCC85|nr:hypothetical protein [Methylorubrum rhodinum]